MLSRACNVHNMRYEKKLNPSKSSVRQGITLLKEIGLIEQHTPEKDGQFVYAKNTYTVTKKFFSPAATQKLVSALPSQNLVMCRGPELKS